MAESSTPTPTSAKKPAARARKSGGSQPKKRSPQRAGAASTAVNPAVNPAANGNQNDWSGFNRVVSRYLGKHENADIGQTTLGEVMSWYQAQQRQRPKTMAAGAA